MSNFDFFFINCVLNAPLMLLSITGNALVLAAILRTPSLRSPSTVFLCFPLCLRSTCWACDTTALRCCFTKPGLLLLTATSTLIFIAYDVSLCTMTLISVDRFLALQYHMRYSNLISEKRALTASAAIWLICVFISCLTLWKKSYALLTFAIAICLFISTFSYIKVYFVVRRHQLQIHAQQQAVESLNAAHNLNMVRSKKSAINTFVYYICMILCHCPVFISMLIFAISSKPWTVAWTLVDTVAFINSAINPFLYCWRTRELRAAAFKTLRNILCTQTDEN